MAEDSNKQSSKSNKTTSRTSEQNAEDMALDANRFSSTQQVSGSPVNPNAQKSAHTSLAKKLLDLLLSWMGKFKEPYHQDPAQQQKVADTIKGLDKVQSNFEKEGKYVEAYITSRKSAVLQACHQSAMGGHIKEDGTIEPWSKKNEDKFAAQVMKNYAVLCEDIEKSPKTEIALRDYTGAKGEKALAEIRNDVQSKIGGVVNLHLGKETQQIMDRIIDVDLKGVAQINQTRPQTPHEKAQMDNPSADNTLSRDQNRERQPGQDRDRDRDRDRDHDHDHDTGLGMGR